MLVTITLPNDWLTRAQAVTNPPECLKEVAEAVAEFEVQVDRFVEYMKNPDRP